MRSMIQLPCHPMIAKLLTFLVLLSVSALAVADSPYQSPEDFLGEVFAGSPPAPGVVWLKREVKEAAGEILGHSYPGIRVRYWGEDRRTAWILEEIGKTQPITVGLVVNENALESIRVLAFRESRGWEVRYPFFTDQFSGLQLTSDRRLDRPVDGISGATLSVRALKKLARLALYLHQQTEQGNDATP